MSWRLHNYIDRVILGYFGSGLHNSSLSVLWTSVFKIHLCNRFAIERWSCAYRFNGDDEVSSCDLFLELSLYLCNRTPHSESETSTNVPTKLCMCLLWASWSWWPLPCGSRKFHCCLECSAEGHCMFGWVWICSFLQGLPRWSLFGYRDRPLIYSPRQVQLQTSSQRRQRWQDRAKSRAFQIQIMSTIMTGRFACSDDATEHNLKSVSISAIAQCMIVSLSVVFSGVVFRFCAYNMQTF